MLNEMGLPYGMEGAIQGSMKPNRVVTTGAALLLAVFVGGFTAEAGQRDSHGRDRNGRASRGQTQSQQPAGGQQQAAPQASQPQAAPPQRSATVAPRSPQRIIPAPAPGAPAASTGPAPAPVGAARHYAVPRPVAPAPRPVAPYYAPRGYAGHAPYYGYPYRPYRYYPYPVYTYAPRPIYPAYYPPHYYGSGGHFSVYFGWGNGYLYGAPWTGPVYGYVAPQVTQGSQYQSSPVYYGDVRLVVTPRDAQVYVDGYYAGVVDDFDGRSQKLTIEAGPHQLELDAQGAEPKFFDVYVDPSKTVEIHADLFR